jgi:hypothetical protein
MTPNKHLLLATIATLGIALVFANDTVMAESLAAKKPAGEAKDKGFEKEIQVESWSFGGAQPKTGGQNQIQSNDTAGAQKHSAPKGAVASPPGKAAGADGGAVDGRDFLIWRKGYDAPATGPGKIGTPPQPAGAATIPGNAPSAGPTDLGAKDPKEAPLIVPAVQAAREAARRSPNTQKGGTDIKK